MSDVEDSHSDDSTNNEVEEVTNEQYRRPRTDDQNNNQLTKRLKLDDPSHVLLVEDILHHLFSFFNIKELVKMSRVCKVWQIVSRQKIKFVSTASFYDPGIRPDAAQLLVYKHKPMNISLIKNVLEQTDKTVTQVYIQGSYQEVGYAAVLEHTSPEVCRILSDYCPNLTLLSLTSLNMSHILCSNLGKCLPPNLKSLEIRKCYELEDQHFGKILGNCKNLENLVIMEDGDNSFRGLSIIENLNNGQLKMLSLVECHFIDETISASMPSNNESWRSWKGFHIFRILKMFTSSLRVLDLGCLATQKHSLGHSLLPCNLTEFNLLETFNFRGYKADIDTPRTQYSNLEYLLNVMPNLKILKLTHCRFSDCYFKLLPKCVPQLKELHILNSLPLYKRDIYFLSELENLEKLVMDGLFDMYCDHDYYDSDEDEFHHHSLPDQAKEVIITHLVAVIIKCPKLKTVIFDDLPLLNDDHVFTMISSMPSLRLLDVNTECMITGSFVSKCADIDRTCPIKVAVNKRDAFPAIPPFMELYNLS